MAKSNVITRPTELTHEGAPASRTTTEQQLRRSVMACLLWEDSFYESGASIATRIKTLCEKVDTEKVCQIAIEARTKQNLRHVPLWLLVHAIRNAKTNEGRAAIGRAIPQILLRADEPGELLALYWKDGKCPITRQMKIGIANAFKKFDEYQLAKYNRDGAVKIRDVMFLVHPKPDDEAQIELFKKVAADTLATPDTWEVQLSGGADKKETFERLIREKNLGGMALLRNLRNMKDSKVDRDLVKSALKEMKTDRILPFRFISAARHAPGFESEIEEAMLRCLGAFDKLPGKTAIVVDNSGSMHGPKVSSKSEIDRADAACALAVMVRETCEDCVVIGFGNDAKVIPSRRGMALMEAIKRGPGGGTNTQNAVSLAKSEGYDRVIVITDEQSHQAIEGPGKGKTGYVVNVAMYQNGIGYGAWTHIDGWSESVLSYIHEAERS